MSFSARSHLSMRVKPSAGPYFCGIDDREKGGERGQLQLLLLSGHVIFLKCDINLGREFPGGASAATARFTHRGHVEGL